MTITLSGDDEIADTADDKVYTFAYGSDPVIVIDEEFSGYLCNSTPTISFSVSADVSAIYAEVYDDLGSVGVDILTKVSTDNIVTPSGKWSVEISEVSSENGVTNYTMTLIPINITENPISGFAKITVVDTSSNKSSQTVAFEYIHYLTMSEIEDGYELKSNSTLFIIDSEISDYTPLTSALSKVSGITLYLPNVTAIGEKAFYGCSSLERVYIPAAKEIEYMAFLSCASLTSIELPEATTIVDGAFYGCSSLTSVELPEATSIGNSAFYKCTRLTSFYAPNATTIEAYAFSYSTNLTSVTLATTSQLTEVESEIFKNVATTGITLTIGSSNSSYYDTDAVTFGSSKEYTFKEIIVTDQN